MLMVTVGAAALGGFLIRMGLQADTGFWQEKLLEHGPVRLLRWFLILMALLWAPWMLKKIGWDGKGDVGWSSRQLRVERRRDFIRWFLLGLVSMSVLYLLSILSGIRDWKAIPVFSFVYLLCKGFLVVGLAVALFEETLVRGILYRTLSRVWIPWFAAIVTSLIFAWTHFMNATPESFEQGVPAIVHSLLFAEFSRTAAALPFFNLFFFGIVLCRLVHFRGDIWAAVGLHAAAAGTLQVFSQVTTVVPEAEYVSWIGGHSSRFDDGWFITLILFVLFCLNEFRNRPLLPFTRVHN